MYVLVKNGNVKQYPYNGSLLIRDNPQTSFPSELSDEVLLTHDVHPVMPVSAPEFNKVTQRLEETNPAKIDDKWYQQWSIVEKTHEELQSDLLSIQEAIVSKVQERLDEFVKTRNYDGILSASTYATSVIEKFRIEGQYAVKMRDLTWAALYDYMEKVQSNVFPIPMGYEDVEAMLPDLEWPIIVNSQN